MPSLGSHPNECRGYNPNAAYTTNWLEMVGTPREKHYNTDQRQGKRVFVMERILVAGSTGYLGRYLVQALKERGFRVRALTRNVEALDRPGKQLAPALRACVDEVFRGEATDPATLRGVCDGVDCVVSALGITRQKDGVTYKDVDYQANLNLLREAEASGIASFMYISVFKGDVMPGVMTGWKEKFVERLKQSDVPYVVIRPTGYYSDMGEYLTMARKGRVLLIGKGDRSLNPIHGADLAAFCAERLSVRREELPVGGPRAYTHREIAQLAFQSAGRREKYISVPPRLFRLAIQPLRLASPNAYGAAEFLCNVMTQDLVAPSYGTRELRAHFEQLMEQA